MLQYVQCHNDSCYQFVSARIAADVIESYNIVTCLIHLVLEQAHSHDCYMNIAAESLEQGVNIYTLHFYRIMEHSTVNVAITAA